MKKKGARGFYDALSSDYDSMIGFDKSLIKRIELLKNFIFPEDKAAADLGCGSGLDSIALARLGLDVTGFDISPLMVTGAGKNARRLKLKINFVTSPIDKIDKSFNGKFSFALSLGNSLANLDPGQLLSSLKRMHSLLAPGGHILIQILNYDRILKSKERIVGITENEEYIFVRFYDFGERQTFFNVLKIRRGEASSNSLITTEIFPYRSSELTRLLKQAGFTKTKKYGGLNQSPYNPSSSTDLVIAAFR